MIQTIITVDDAVVVLNRALKEDPVAISHLFGDAHREPCNEALEHDETIQVRGYDPNTGLTADASVGLLGIINGFFGTDDKGYGAIAAVVEERGEITAFIKREPWE